jgi:hypothetical protein
MLLASLFRHTWTGLLAVTPRPVLSALDTWAQAQALRRAELRRRRLLQRQQARRV